MRLDLKARLLFLLIVPLFFVMLLSSMILLEIYDDKKNLEFTRHHILEAETISKVVHYMQIERGVTSGLIAAGNLDENNENLLEAKKNLNRALEDAREIISDCTVCRNNVDTLAHLDKIKSRNSDNLLGLSTINARAYYTKNIAFFLDLIKSTPAQMDDMENRNYIQAYSYLSSAKESLGQTRAILVELFTSKEYLDEPFTAFKEDLRIYSLETNNFKTTAPMDILNFYYDVYRGEVVDETFRMINIAVKNRYAADLGIEPPYWFEKSTQTINLLKEVEDRLFNDVKILINDKLDFTSYKLVTLIAFLIISAIVVTFLMILIVRKILFSADNLEREYGNSQALLEQYKSTVDGTFIVSKTDAEGIITYVNEEFCKLSGYSKEELIGKSHNIMRHPDMQKEVFTDLWHTIKDLKKTWVGDMKNLSKDGSSHWLRAIINPILDSDGNVVEYIGMRTDITQQKEITRYFENQLKISTKNFDFSMHLSKEYEKAIDSSTILSRVDKYGNITYANDKFLEISGYSLNELVGKSQSAMGQCEVAKEESGDVWQEVSSGKIWHGIIRNITKSGKDFWAKTTIVPIKDLNEEIVEYLVIKFDITEIVEQRKEFERIAKTDPLTGCGNRFRLNYEMQELENISVAVFNIDNFRQINDFYGHQFGDMIIKFTANKIYNLFLRDEKFRFYRLQGDEFIAIAIDYSKELLIEKVKQILAAIKEKFTIKDKDMLISCTCGISFEDKEYLLSTANMALKVAKKSNVDFLVYREEISLNRQYENNITWTRKLSNALKEKNIITYYQPIVKNSDLSYEKYECLVRIKDGAKVVSPFFFLDVAKQTRQYFDITKTVLYQAFEMFKEKDVEFSINLSILDILEPKISKYILSMLKKYDIGSRVVFEIVESEYMENFEGVMNFIGEIKKYNCKIAIDDFGTGYSNFEYLIKLKADYLKIDGSIIKNIDKDENAYLVVSTIVEFSKKLGMKTIAEYVESEEIFKIVKELGIDYSQGYYFSEPKEGL
ncbi:EAL domain-containing protein [Sulfurimonas crateris]|uniref:EAL domain-containing protein n=1 Tax=Sulfurimonas crateris TaxID=2574727 RepID=A0A4U2Z9F5_9BACT|nr:EAL domain-containing protein [Sulfurimonas crateris]TKI70948.1 EAL domain-containing protein [Sulfurimonas crateris]